MVSDGWHGNQCLSAEVMQGACGQYIFSDNFSVTPSPLILSRLHLSSSSISPVARLTALVSLLLIALVTQPSTCNRDDAEGDEQVDALPVQLSVTAQVTPTPLWAVVWGPTQPLEDETYHFLSSQETDPLHHRGSQQGAGTATSEDWPHPGASVQPREETPLESREEEEGVEDGGTEAEETEPEQGGHQGMHLKDF